MSKLDELKASLKDAEDVRDVYDVAKDAICELERGLRVVEAARKHRGPYREESPGSCGLTDALREYDSGL